MVRKRKKHFRKFGVPVPEQTIQEHATIRNSIAPLHQAADDEALRIHGLGKFESSSDSDSGKSDFDEEYYKYRPGPILIDKKKLVVIDKENRPQQKSKRVTSNTSYSSVVKEGDSTTQYLVNQNEGKNKDPLEDLKSSLVFINSNFPPLNENAALTAIAAKPFISSGNRDATKIKSRNAVSESSAISRNTSTFINSNTLLKDSELHPFKAQASTETNSQIKYVDADFYSLVGQRSAFGDTRGTSKGQLPHKLSTKRSQSSVHSNEYLGAASNAENSNLFNISGHITDVNIPSPISAYPYSSLSDLSIFKCNVKPPDLSDLILPDTYLKYPTRRPRGRGINSARRHSQRSSRSNLIKDSPHSEPSVVDNEYQRQLGEMFTDRLDSPRTTSTAASPVLRNQSRASSTTRSANTIVTPRPVLEVAPSVVIAQPILRPNSTENCEGNRDSAHGLMSEDTSCRSYKYFKYICCVC